MPVIGKPVADRFWKNRTDEKGRRQMKVRKAIIPAAGLGTRFLPATKAQPKEMLPIVKSRISSHFVKQLLDDVYVAYQNKFANIKTKLKFQKN